MRSDIFYHLTQVIVSNGLVLYICSIFGFICLMAYLNYIETLTITQMTTYNYGKILFKLVILNLFYKIVGNMRDLFKNNWFDLNILNL